MRSFLTTLVLLTGITSGCIVAARPGPPPPDRVEVIGVAPWPGAFWVRGGWRWHEHEGRWGWERGHWR